MATGGPIIRHQVSLNVLGLSGRKFSWTPASYSRHPPGRTSKTLLRAATALTGSYVVFEVVTNHLEERRHFRVLSRTRQALSTKLKRDDGSRGESCDIKELDDRHLGPSRVCKVIQELKADPLHVKSPTGWSLGGLSFLQTSLPITTLSEMMQEWTWTPAFAQLQSKLNALILELGRGPGSLYSEIVDNPPDTAVSPEVEWDASVRLGDELCFSERVFLRERKVRMRKSFAELFGVPVDEIDERDLPIVAIAASGGGFRAMCNTAGALIAAKNSGILDCTTYLAGISGSCWTLGALYSGVAGSHDPSSVAQYLRRRVEIPYLDSQVLDLLVTPPTNKYLLSGIIRKASGPLGTVSLVDIYGTLISARLFCPEDLSILDPRHLSLSYFRTPVDDASLPMPIFTAISRHLSTTNLASSEASIPTPESGGAASYYGPTEKNWLWYEFSPYEVGCDELGAWIPSWSLGRRFEQGKSKDRSPQVSFAILAGIHASAFCASLQHYYTEARPILEQLPSTLYEWVSDIINERQKDFGFIHPILPNQLPNFVKGMEGQLRLGSPPGIEEPDTLGFMDAGAELNIPYYPLLRRNVDCIIALDASADSQDLWFTKAEAYAAKKGLHTWPRGAQWPKEVMPTGKASLNEGLQLAVSSTPSLSEGEDANRRLAESRESEVVQQATKQQDADERQDPTSPQASGTKSPSSTYVWIGTSSNDPERPSKVDVFDEETLSSHDGIGIVYMPILANESAVPGVDPYEVSTWRFEMTQEESRSLMNLAEHNFLSGQDKVVTLLKAMWLRKKRARVQAEETCN